MSDRVMLLLEPLARHVTATPYDGPACFDPAINYTCPTHTVASSQLRTCDCWQRRSWRLLTLTTRAPADDRHRWDVDVLRYAVRVARKAFRTFWRSTPWGRQVNHIASSGKRGKRSRRDSAFVFGLEIAPGGMVHVHALVYGEFVLKSVLEEAWTAAIHKALSAGSDRRERCYVKVQAVTFKGRAIGGDVLGIRSALAEVVKYATKGQTSSDGKEHMPNARKSAAVELAFQSVRRVEYGGAFRMVSGKRADDVTRAAIAEAQESCCQTCGIIGELTHLASVRPSSIARNKGFGIYLLTLPRGRDGPRAAGGGHRNNSALEDDTS